MRAFILGSKSTHFICDEIHDGNESTSYQTRRHTSLQSPAIQIWWYILDEILVFSFSLVDISSMFTQSDTFKWRMVVLEEYVLDISNRTSWFIVQVIRSNQLSFNFNCVKCSSFCGHHSLFSRTQFEKHCTLSVTKMMTTKDLNASTLTQRCFHWPQLESNTELEMNRVLCKDFRFYIAFVASSLFRPANSNI